MVRAERRLHVPVPREALWRLISDTDRLNREVGLPPVHFAHVPREDGGTYLRGRATFGGVVTVRYREEPYCWVRPLGFSVNRWPDRGPLRYVRLGVDLADGADGGTDVVAWFEVEPTLPLAAPLARRVAESGVGGLERMATTFAAFLTGAASDPYPRHAGIPEAQALRLREGQEAAVRLGAEPALAERLAAFLRQAPIEDVTNFRPFPVADRWGVTRRALLETCLLAVRAGILEMRWRLLCPACRGAGEATESLERLSRGEPHCPSCDIRFGREFDRNVEVCFTVAPRVRPPDLGAATFCIGGPQTSPHVLAQWFVPGGASADLACDFPPGAYVLSSPQARQSVAVTLEGQGDAEIALCHSPQHKRVDIVPPSPTLPARGTLRVANRHDRPVLLRVETQGWLTDTASAAAVTSLQRFRDLFSSEVLSADAEIAVRQVAILFSDIRGSTALYAERGDAPSYAAVRDHFAFLRGVVSDHNGAVLKTLGDAVMAVFADPTDAVAAAVEIQRRAPEQTEPFVVKLGLASGPALAVNANDRLDYFGQTVNRAARIQAESVGGDIVLPAALAEDARIREVIGGLRAEPFTVALRGDSGGPNRLLRLWPPAEETEP